MLAAFLLSMILTAAARTIAARVGFTAVPVENRHHRKPVPLGGGAAIFGTITAIILAAIGVVKFGFAGGYFDWLGESVVIHTAGFMSKAGELLIVLLCVFILFAAGLYDDKKHLGPGAKLAVQFAAAIMAASLGQIRVEFFIESKIITTLLSAIWIVLIINVFNFLDNMDGACAGIAVIASCILFTVAALNGQVFIGALAIILTGTLAGFLVFNFPPARIFMGDAGSMVIGFLVAILTLRTTYYNQAQSGGWYAVFVPLIVMAVPLYDFLSVTFLRIKQGKSPFIGDTQHFSHRLKGRGLTDRQTVLTLYLATLCTGIGAGFLNQVNMPGAILVFAQTFMILAIIAIFEATSQKL